MKKNVPFLLLLCAGCSYATTETPASTVDSNTVSISDSTPAILHLDNLQNDTSSVIAMDSIGPTVDAGDTIKQKN